MSCPKCSRRRKNKKSLSGFFPSLNFFNCFNCRKKFVWITVFNKVYFLQKTSLLK